MKNASGVGPSVIPQADPTKSLIKNLAEYRNSALEQLRTQDLLALIPEQGQAALDVGARDGHFSRILATRFPDVVALDLDRPPLEIPRVRCVAGDVTRLEFADNAFDFVLCAEVLEHIPPALLQAACAQLARVTRRYLLIGVPFREDLRVSRTRCGNCRLTNPPWGHVNSFDGSRIQSLFHDLVVDRCSLVGESVAVTNSISAKLMDLAGHPFGTYGQDEHCIHCDSEIGPAPSRNLAQKLMARVACVLDGTQMRITPPRPKWIHVLLRKC